MKINAYIYAYTIFQDAVKGRGKNAPVLSQNWCFVDCEYS